ncbi:LysR substrate-binding domain-containing protein [Rhizobium johnstonii]
MLDLALDLRFLRYAILVAEHGSFRRAAEVLNLSQSTLSRRVQLLERRLGIPLFERMPSGVRPTTAGERFLKEATFGAGHLQQAIDALSNVGRGEIGRLRLGLVASLGRGFLTDLLELYRRRYPFVEVTFEEATSQQNVAGVVNGRLDAAFIRGSARLQGLKREHLWDEKIYVALPRRHQLASGHNIKLDDIRHETFLIAADAAGPDAEDFIVRQLSSVGFRPKIQIQRVGRENLINLVAIGFGFTLVGEAALGVTYPEVVFLPLANETHIISSEVVWSPANSNPALKRLLQVSRDLKRGRQKQ